MWAAVRHPPGFLFLTPESPTYPKIYHTNCSLQLPCNPKEALRSVTFNVSLTPPPDALLFTFFPNTTGSNTTTSSTGDPVPDLYQNALIFTPSTRGDLFPTATGADNTSGTFLLKLASLFSPSSLIAYGSIGLLCILLFLVFYGVRRILLSLRDTQNQQKLIAAATLAINKKRGGDEVRQAEVWLASIAAPSGGYAQPTTRV